MLGRKHLCEKKNIKVEVLFCYSGGGGSIKRRDETKLMTDVFAGGGHHASPGDILMFEVLLSSCY